MSYSKRDHHCRTHHVVSKGNNAGLVFFSDADRERWLAYLAQVCDRTGWTVEAYVLMGNHYHLLVAAPEGTLSVGMHLLNQGYARACNKANERTGHIFGRRFWDRPIATDGEFHAVAAYIHLNPVRAETVAEASLYRWSSLPAILGDVPCPWFLDPRSVLDGYVRHEADPAAAYRASLARMAAAHHCPAGIVDRQAIIAAAAAGIPTARIAAAHGIHRSTVARVLAAHRLSQSDPAG